MVRSHTVTLRVRHSKVKEEERRSTFSFNLKFKVYFQLAGPLSTMEGYFQWELFRTDRRKKYPVLSLLVAICLCRDLRQ